MARKPTKKPAKEASKKAPKKKPAPAKAPAKPKLLSGGNPQIPKGDGNAPVRAYLDALPGWKQDVGRRLDELIVETVPGVQKAVRWNTPFYGLEGQGWFVAFHCMTKYIKITFFKGTQLRPAPPVSSKVKDVRYWHVDEGEELDEKQFVKWVRQASRLDGSMIF